MSNISTHLNSLSFLNNLNYNSDNIKFNSVSYNCSEVISPVTRNSLTSKDNNIWRNISEAPNITSSNSFGATSSATGIAQTTNSFTNNINCNPLISNTKSTPRIITKSNKKELHNRMNDGDIKKFSNGDGMYKKLLLYFYYYMYIFLDILFNICTFGIQLNKQTK